MSTTKSYIQENKLLDVPGIVADSAEFDLFPRLLPEVYDIRMNDFPLLDECGRAYLDNTATGQTPRSARVKFFEYMDTHLRGSNHSEHSDEAREAQGRYAKTKQKLADFFSAYNYCIAYTSGTSDASIAVATRFDFEGADVRFLFLTEAEHNSQHLTPKDFALRSGAAVEYVPVTYPEGRLDLDALEDLARRTDGKILLYMVHVSNVTGVINPAKRVREILGDRAIIYLDMAQSAGQIPIDLDDLDVDFAGISAHKTNGPMGIGALFVNKRSDRYLNNRVIGGGAVDIVSKTAFIPLDSPERLEPGTQNIEGAIWWGYTLDYLMGIGMERIEAHDRTLGEYFLGELQKIDRVHVYGPTDFVDRTAVVPFNIGDTLTNHEQVASELNSRGVSVRNGCFCAPIYVAGLMGRSEFIDEMIRRTLTGNPPKPKEGAVRASFSFYNTLADVYKAVDAVREIAASI